MDSKTMNLLHKIENKYGSITKCPEDDLDYIKLRKIYPLKRVDNNIDLEEKIISYAEKGYSEKFLLEIAFNRKKFLTFALERLIEIPVM